MLVAAQAYLSPSIAVDWRIENQLSQSLLVETSMGLIDISATTSEIAYVAMSDSTGLIQTVLDVNVPLDIIALAYAKGITDSTSPIESSFVAVQKALSSYYGAVDAAVDISIGYLREYLSSVSLADTAVKALNLFKSSQIGNTDALYFFVGKVLSENQAVSDLTYRNIGKAATDNQSQTDLHGIGFGRTSSSAQGVIDAYSAIANFFRSFTTDSVLMVDDADFNNGDGLEYQFVKAVSETQSAADAYAKVIAYTRAFVDNNGATELVSYALLKALSSSATETDVISLAFITSYASSTSALDGVSLATNKNQSDTQSSSDGFNRVASFSRSHDSQQVFSDVVALATSRLLSSVGSTTDAFNRACAFVRAYADTAASVADGSNNTVGKGLGDQQGTQDDSMRLFGIGLGDLQSTVDYRSSVILFDRLMSDTQSQLDDLNALFAKTNADSQLVADVFGRANSFFRNSSDQQSTSDSVSKQPGVVAQSTVVTGVDGDGINESILNGYVANANIGGDYQSFVVGKGLSDIQGQSDLFGRVVSFNNNHASQQGLADAIAFFVVVSLAENQMSSDIFSRACVFAKAYSDIFGVVDGYANAVSKSLSDIQVQSDLFNRACSFARAHVSSVVTVDDADFNSGDGLEYQFTKSVAEVQILLDVYARTVAYIRGFADGNSVTELLSYAISRVIASSATEADAFDRVCLFVKAYTDAVAAIDGSNRIIGKGLGDSQGVIDAYSRLFGFGYGDSQSTSDSVQTSSLFPRSLADSQSQIDIASKIFGKPLNDLQLQSDGINVASTFVKAYTDSASMTDSIYAGLSFSRTASSVVYANPAPVPVNGWMLNHFVLNNSPGGDKFSYNLLTPIPSAMLNGLVVNRNLLNGNLIAQGG